MQFGLVENHLTAAPNDFTAQPVNIRSITLDEIYRRFLARNPRWGLSQLQASTEKVIDEVCRVVQVFSTQITHVCCAKCKQIEQIITDFFKKISANLYRATAWYQSNLLALCEAHVCAL